MRLRPFHIMLFLLGAGLIRAQEPFHNPVHLTPAEGLPHSWVYDFEEDEQGFIWIGTYGGLCRFDGSSVLPVDDNGPPLRVRSLQRTGDTLWIGAFDGAALMDLGTGRLENFPVYQMLKAEKTEDQSVRAMYQDRQGYLWMAPAHQGFVRLNPATGQLRHFPLPPSETIPAVHSDRDKYSLMQIVQDVEHDSIFWGITFCDLVKLNAVTGKVDRYRCEHGNEEMAYNINRHKSMHAHSDGKIYLGSWERGLSVFDPSTERYTIPFENGFKDWRRQLNKEHLHGIFPKNELEIYLTYSSGLYLYNVEKQSVKIIQRNIFNPFVRQTYGVSFRDSAGRLWNCLAKNGVQLFDPMVNQYAYFPLDTLNKTEDMFLPRNVIENFYPGYVTLSGQYSDGLYHLNPTTGHAFKTPAPREHMANHKYFQSWGAAQISPDELIVSEIRGLHYYKKGQGELQRFSIQPEQKYNSLGPIAFDGNRCLWNGAFADGLWMLDLYSKEVQNYTPQIGQSRISGIFRDSRANIWFCFPGGHAVMQKGQSEFRVFYYEKDTLHTLPVIEDFCECPNGEIWVAANTTGIAQLSPDGVIKTIPLQDSTGPELAFRITCDPDNNLWVKGNNHLIFFDRKKETITKYNYDYGLSKVDGLIRFLRSGQLLIGSREGIYIVNPNQLGTNQSTPKPYVTGTKTKRGAKGRLEDFLNKKTLQLPHDENALTIEFAAINFTLPQATKFRYKLEGVDETWNDPGKNRAVTYSNLKGGEYVFLLRAANNEGIWSGRCYELPIVIRAAWHETSWFYALLSLGVVGLVLGIYKSRVGAIRKEEHLRSEFEIQIANVEMNALRAQMNPHFIFNCLNSIDRYIISNDMRKASEYLNHFGRLIRLILQNSRANYVNLKDEIEALELYIKLEQMRFHHAFCYQINIETGLNPENYEVPPMLIQPFVENAIWHGLNPKEAKGVVRVEIRMGEDVLICTVEDDGIGRAAAKAIKEAQPIKRKSMGMHITEERIKIINKLFQTNNKIDIIDLYDEEGKAKGTRVVLHIPI